MNVFLSVSYYLTPQSYYVFLGMLKSMWILNGKKEMPLCETINMVYCARMYLVFTNYLNIR